MSQNRSFFFSQASSTIEEVEHIQYEYLQSQVSKMETHECLTNQSTHPIMEKNQDSFIDKDFYNDNYHFSGDDE